MIKYMSVALSRVVGGGRDPPAHLYAAGSTPCAPAHRRFPRKAKVRRKRTRVRGVEEMCYTHAAVVPVARWNDTSSGTLLRTTVVL